MSRRTRKREVEGSPVRRLAGVAGTIAATALCFSFAGSIVGGALRPALVPATSPIVVAVEALPVPPARPPVRHRRAKPPVVTVRLAESSARVPAPRPRSTGTDASASRGIGGWSTSVTVSSETRRASALLRSESKASRTRGQPVVA